MASLNCAPLQRSASLWQRLTEPAASVTARDDRRKARLLASLLLALLALGFVFGLVFPFVSKAKWFVSRNDAFLTVGSLVTLFALYLLSRTRHSALAAKLAVALVSLVVFLLAVHDGDKSDAPLLIYLAVPALLSSMFLSLRTTLLVIVSQMAGMAVFALAFQAVPDEADWMGFVVIITTLIWLSAYHQTQLEADRRAELLDAQDRHQRQAERARRQSEEHYRSLVDNLPIGVYRNTPGPQGRFLVANPALLHLFGFESEVDLAQVSVADLYLEPAERARFSAMLLAQGSVTGVELRLKRRDGAPIWASVTARVVRGEDDDALYFDCAMEDITARKQAEQQLRESEARYRHLFDNMLNGFAVHEMVTDASGKPVDYVFLEANRAFEDQTGLRAADLIGRRVTEVIPGIEKSSFIDIYGRVALTGQPVRFEQFAEPLNRHYDIAAFSPRRGQFATVFSDITERVQASEALRESEEMYRELFEGVDDTITVHDLAGNLLAVNEAACRRLGYAREELLRMNVSDLDESDFGAHFHERLERQLAEGRLSDIRGTHIAKDGRRIDIDVTSKVIHYHGQPAILAVVRDITERKRIEETLYYVAQRSWALTGEAFFRALARYLGETLGVSHTLIGELIDSQSEVVRTVALYASGSLADNIEYDLRDTPCEHVARQQLRCYPQGVRQLFPHDALLAQMEVDSYIGAPLWDADGQPLGVIVAMDRKPLADPPLAESLLRIVAMRVAHELARRRVERALRDSEERYRLISELISDYAYSYYIQPDHTLVPEWITSDSFERITGFTWEELDRRGTFALYHPDDAPTVQRDLARVLTGQMGSGEYRIITKSGDLRWLHIYRRPVWDEQQHRVVRMYGVAQDITARKQAEQAEREQRALADALRDTAAALNTTLDLNEVLDLILDNIGRVVPYDLAELMTVEGDVARIARVRSRNELVIDSAALIGAELRLSSTANLRQMEQTGAPICVPDTRDDPDWIVLPRMEWIRSNIGTAIRVGEEILGFVGLDSATPGFFTPEHGERLRAFADQAAVAIRNAQLYGAAQRHVAELEALRRVTLDIMAQSELDSLLQRLVKGALDILGVESGGMYLYRPERNALEWAVSSGPGMVPLGMELKRGEGLAGKVWQQNAPLIVNNYSDWEGRLPTYEPYHLTAVVAIPIFWQGQLLGVFDAIADSTQRSFTERDLRLLSLFANQAAIAIQNATLLAAEREQRALSEALRDTAAALNTTLDLNEVLDLILENIGRVVPYDLAELMTVEGDVARIARLRSQIEAEIDSAALAQFEFQVSELADLRHMKRTGEPVLCPDTRADPVWIAVPQLEWVRSYSGVAIRYGDEVLGFIILDSATPNFFTLEHGERLRAFADQAAMALNNAHLYEELEQRVIERTIDLSVRNEVASTLSGSLDMDNILNGVLRTTVRQLDVAGGAIYLLTDDGDTLNLAAHYGVSPDTLLIVTGIRPGSTTANENGATPRVLAGSLPELAEGTGVAAVLSVPIWEQGRVQGIITLINDQPRPWRSADTRLLDAIGRQIGVALTNARLYQEAVRGEAHIRAILQSVADGLLVFDQDGKLALLNPAAEALFTFYPAETGGPRQAAMLFWRWLQSRGEALYGPDPIEFALPIASLLGTGQSSVAGQCMTQNCGFSDRSDAAWPCWLWPGGIESDELRHCPIYQRIPRRSLIAHSAQVGDASGATWGTVIALHDVTYFRELDDLKGKFVSTVSHELRTPLSVIMLQVSTVLRYYERLEDSDRRGMITEIQQQTHTLRELIEDILELSRFDAKRAMPQKQWFDLVAHCQDAVTAILPTVEEKRLTVDTARCAGSRYIHADPTQIMRVLSNLLSNAVKYTPPGGRIALGLDQVGDLVRLEVSDTGIGIPSDEQLYVFDRFYRVDEAAKMASGTGLGLAITKEIVDLHHGRIELHSAPGEGSAFAVYLPITQVT